MNRVLGHCLAAAVAIGGGAALVLACQHDDESLFVQNVIFPTPVAQGNSCTYTNDPNQSFLPKGALDVALNGIYTAVFLLGNQLVSRSNPQQLQAETSTINVEGAVVRVTAPDGTQLNSFTSLTSGTVYPSTGTVPGYAAISAQILDQGSVQAVSGGSALSGSGFVTIVTYTKFFGHTLGGTYVESNEFEFPIDICKGCLISITQQDENQCFTLPNCKGGSGSSSSLPIPCVPGQDTVIDCSQCPPLHLANGTLVNNPLCDPPATNICGDAGTD
jgi:hypothetical protein